MTVFKVRVEMEIDIGNAVQAAEKLGSYLEADPLLLIEVDVKPNEAWVFEYDKRDGEVNFLKYKAI